MLLYDVFCHVHDHQKGVIKGENGGRQGDRKGGCELLAGPRSRCSIDARLACSSQARSTSDSPSRASLRARATAWSRCACWLRAGCRRVDCDWIWLISSEPMPGMRMLCCRSAKGAGQARKASATQLSRQRNRGWRDRPKWSWRSRTSSVLLPRCLASRAANCVDESISSSMTSSRSCSRRAKMTPRVSDRSQGQESR